MFELRPFERRNNHVAAYDPWDQMERAFFGDGSWGRGLSEFKTDIQDKGDSYLLEADLPGFKKEDIHVDVDGDTMTIRAAARGAKFPFSSRGPPKKRKARSPERTFANIFCTTPCNPKKFRARRRAMILIVFCRDRR